MNVQPSLLNLSAYINQNLEKDLPLSTLAKRVGLSPFHFHRKFGAYFGESLHQHIKRLRLERAAFALVHGSAPVRQIARDSGYKTVSAFSHAFSGFAGESPTRYRSLALEADGRGDADEAAMEPTWVGDLEPLEFMFVRAQGRGRDVERPIHDAVEQVIELAGPPVSDGSDGDGVDGMAHESLDFIAATGDVYGFIKDASFRIDVGVVAARVAAERSALLGRQVLPGGRYARFDLHCHADEVVARASGISFRVLQSRGETPRGSQYFVRFAPKGRNGTMDADRFQLFVPLTA